MQLSGTYLLVTDASDVVRQNIAHYLEGSGPELIQAGCASDALELCRSQQPGLVLCDLQLAKGDALGLVHKLVSLFPDMPIIVLADSNSTALIADALQIGAVDYLIKPLNEPRLLQHALQRALSRVSLQLDNQRIHERLESTNRELQNHLQELRDDQAAGHQVQLNMLPTTPWKSGEYSFEHRIIPSLYLSGDFVDYFRVSDTQLAFYLADVSGHGASSAFATVLLKFMTTRLLYEQRKLADQGHIEFKPSDVLGHINRSLISCKLGKHVTMLGGVIDESSSTLTYSIGGHLPLPVLYSEGKAVYLQGKGRPVGLFADASYEDHQISLPEQFSLTLCSDGVLDCLEGTTLREKEARLPMLVEEVGGSLRGLLGKLNLQPGKVMPDDISLMVLSRQPG
ncbi:MAG: fused response regulator/phosphatase [Gammaproteobacteria bacterium HGW-Gammaproteobacteria-6]|nr:MAG: fused response regulator/phosphatase [Gammaproteobacteria bacterium HGW-Gammaproteobacteria-6]